MTNYNILQGTDNLLQVRMLDGNNLPLDLTTATAIRVGLFIKNVLANKYSDTVIAGYGVCSINAIDKTVIDILVTREESKLFPTGVITCSILVEIPDAVLTEKRIEYNTFIGQVLKGNMKSELI